MALASARTQAGLSSQHRPGCALDCRTGSGALGCCDRPQGYGAEEAGSKLLYPDGAARPFGKTEASPSPTGKTVRPALATVGPFFLLFALLYAAFGAASPFLPALMEFKGVAAEQIGTDVRCRNGHTADFCTARRTHRGPDACVARDVGCLLRRHRPGSACLFGGLGFLGAACDQLAPCLGAGAHHQSCRCTSARRLASPGLRVRLGARCWVGCFYCRTQSRGAPWFQRSGSVSWSSCKRS